MPEENFELPPITEPGDFSAPDLGPIVESVRELLGPLLEQQSFHQYVQAAISGALAGGHHSDPKEVAIYAVEVAKEAITAAKLALNPDVWGDV